jgi:hypothetical protein
VTCFMERTLDVIGDRWRYLILRQVFVSGSSKFSDVETSLGIVPGTLTDRLTGLVTASVLEKRSYREGAGANELPSDRLRSPPARGARCTATVGRRKRRPWTEGPVFFAVRSTETALLILLSSMMTTLLLRSVGSASRSVQNSACPRRCPERPTIGLAPCSIVSRRTVRHRYRTTNSLSAPRPG